MHSRDNDLTVVQAVSASLQLLNRRDRRRLGLATLAQMSTALLDLVGVLLLGLVTALGVSTATGAVPPAIATRVLDRLGVSSVNLTSLTVGLAAAAALLLTVKSLIGIVISRRVLRFLANRQAAVGGKLVEQLLSRPLVQIQQRSSQETMYALTSGVQNATLIVLGQGVVIAAEASLLVLLAAGLLMVSPVVTLFTTVFFVLVAMVLQRTLAKWAGDLGHQATNLDIASYEAVQEAIATYREVTVMNRRDFYVRRFQDLRWSAASVQGDLQFMGLVPKYIFEIALIFGGGLLALSQLMTQSVTAAVSIIVVFLAAGSRIVPSLLRLQGALISVRGAASQAQPTFRLEKELRESDALGSGRVAIAIEDESHRSTPLSARGEFNAAVLVTDVRVDYSDSSTPALEGVSLSIPAGASVALVGPTGAGKSTLADVILGVVEVDSGHVSIGGIDPLSAIANWPGCIAYVPQEVAMSNGTIRQNVALGLPPDLIDDDLVWEALQRAHLASFLREARDGLDTVVGEHGVRLSGGQRQRLGVARALYTRPRLLVLDEATSALDAETERAISQTLAELEGSVTTVTVAHRLATIRNCDEVVYLEGGRIVARGTFDDVRRASPDFDEQAKLLGL